MSEFEIFLANTELGFVVTVLPSIFPQSESKKIYIIILHLQDDKEDYEYYLRIHSLDLPYKATIDKPRWMIQYTIYGYITWQIQ